MWIDPFLVSKSCWSSDELVGICQGVLSQFSDISPEVEVRGVPNISGSTVWEAHGRWRREFFISSELEGRPQLGGANEKICNIVTRLEILCITNRRRRMAAAYGFSGRYVSALVEEASGEVIDVRSEVTVD